MAFSWKKQLEVGQHGEHLLLTNYHTPLAPATTLTYDFIRLVDGGKVEVKTDTYSMAKTPNFFFERWGNVEEKKPGGPWRARRHGIDEFTYFFVMDYVYFVFSSPKELCARADKLIRQKGSEEKYIKNRAYVTMGYALPREEFSDLYVEYHIPKETFCGAKDVKRD
jgi:hypothetical protein